MTWSFEPETGLPFEARQQVKLKHVNACLLPSSQYQKSAGFEAITLENQSMAAISFGDVVLDTEFLGHKLNAPLMIAPMTGGTELSVMLNQRWARAAQCFNIPFGVGSQRLALSNKEVAQSFRVRAIAKDAMIFANLGAAQIVQHGSEICLQAVEMIEASALFIHVNPLQEACQERETLVFWDCLIPLHRQWQPYAVMVCLSW